MSKRTTRRTLIKAAGAAAVDVLAVARVPAPWRQG